MSLEDINNLPDEIIPGYSRYIDRDYVIVDELPASPRIGAMYLLRASDGSITWHLPELFPDEGGA